MTLPLLVTVSAARFSKAVSKPFEYMYSSSDSSSHQLFSQFSFLLCTALWHKPGEICKKGKCQMPGSAKKAYRSQKYASKYSGQCIFVLSSMSWHHSSLMFAFVAVAAGSFGSSVHLTPAWGGHRALQTVLGVLRSLHWVQEGHLCSSSV